MDYDEVEEVAFPFKNNLDHHSSDDSSWTMEDKEGDKENRYIQEILPDDADDYSYDSDDDEASTIVRGNLTVHTTPIFDAKLSPVSKITSLSDKKFREQILVPIVIEKKGCVPFKNGSDMILKKALYAFLTAKIPKKIFH